MNASGIEIGTAQRPLNAVGLAHAVLCANCDVISDSQHDHCQVCGSRSLLNISRLLGEMPSQRARLVAARTVPVHEHKPVLRFAAPHRAPRRAHHNGPERRDGHSAVLPFSKR